MKWPAKPRPSYLSLRRKGTMSHGAKEERQWTSDVVWVALYSSLLFLLMVAWANIPG